MDDTDEVEMATPSGSSSIGDAVSGRAQSIPYEEDEDDGLFYIPERRPSLDLGPSPMDTSQWHFVDQASPPALSYWSMGSEEKLDEMTDEDDSSTRVQLNRADSFSSCYSFDSDDCEKKTPKVRNKDDDASQPCDTPELIRDPNEIRHPSLTVAFTFKAICTTLGKLPQVDLRMLKASLWKRYPQSFNTPPRGMDLVDLVDRLLECYDLEVSLQITKTLLEDIEQKNLARFLETLCLRNEVRHDLCEILKSKYGEVGEDWATQEKRPFDDIFTNLYITSSCDNGPNIEHEVLNIEKLNTNQKQPKLLSTMDFMCPERLERSGFRFLLIIGVAGSGKSMAMRRLILDWIEERSHQHIGFIFPLPFRELKQFEGSKISLLDIIHTLYPPTKKLRHEDFRAEDDCRIMLVFDGLDEYTERLDFQNTALLSDHTEATTLNVIVVNLLRGRLLYRGIYVVTSRSQVRRYMPWDTPYDEIDVRGFLDPERDEYFKRRFQNPDQAARVIAYINSCKTLRIMCHLPLFCSLVADEHQRLFREQGPQAELPRGITYIYTKLMLTLIRQHRRFRAPDCSPETEREFLMTLGKSAYNMLEKGQYKIIKTEWKEAGLSAEEAVMRSGLCIQYITKPFVLFEEKVISFIHPTMQEYMAALYVFLSFRNHGKNVFEQQLKQRVRGMLKGHKVTEMYKNAVDRSLQCKDGKLDIFLRFLFGMAAKTNQELLQTFCVPLVKWPEFTEDAAALIRKKLRENQHPDRNSNLQRCLEELGV